MPPVGRNEQSEIRKEVLEADRPSLTLAPVARYLTALSPHWWIVYHEGPTLGKGCCTVRQVVARYSADAILAGPIHKEGLWLSRNLPGSKKS